jgi:replicative DNA helicase
MDTHKYEVPKNVLQILTSDEVVDEAIKQIDAGRKPEPTSLKVRWPKINRGVMGGFRFGDTVVIAGLSGHGKSWLLGLITKDFQDSTLNGDFPKPFRHLHFSWDMRPEEELIRQTSSHTKTSYADLLSAYKQKNGEGTLSDEAYEEAITFLDSMRGSVVDYVKVTGTVEQISDTIDWYAGQHPTHELIVSLDYTLQTEYNKEVNEVALVSKLSKMFAKKKNLMKTLNIIIGQLNQDIESDTRISKPAMHYPIKKDIHGSNAIYQDAVIVMVAHSPEQLNIRRYGVKEQKDGSIGFDTGNRLFVHFIKTRHSSPGIVVLEKQFTEGNLKELDL